MQKYAKFIRSALLAVLAALALAVTLAAPAQAAAATRKCAKREMGITLYATVRVYNNNATTRSVRVSWTKARKAPSGYYWKSEYILKSGIWAAPGSAHPATFLTDNKARTIRVQWKYDRWYHGDYHTWCTVVIPKRVW